MTSGYDQRRDDRQAAVAGAQVEDPAGAVRQPGVEACRFLPASTRSSAMYERGTMARSSIVNGMSCSQASPGEIGGRLSRLAMRCAIDALRLSPLSALADLVAVPCVVERIERQAERPGDQPGRLVEGVGGAMAERHAGAFLRRAACATTSSTSVIASRLVERRRGRCLFSTSRLAASTCSSILWMLALTGPSSITCAADAGDEAAVGGATGGRELGRRGRSCSRMANPLTAVAQACRAASGTVRRRASKSSSWSSARCRSTMASKRELQRLPPSTRC